MRISFTFLMRMYSLFSILFFLFGGIAIVIGGPALVAGYGWSDPAVLPIITPFRIVVIAFFGSGFVISSVLFLISMRKGFIAYRRIIDKLSSERSMGFNLNIHFPERDEFGNMGKWLNKFIAMVRDFDRIKVERLRASQQKINALSETMEKGLLLVSNEGKIYFANGHFKKTLNLGEKNIMNLPLDKVIQNDRLQKVLGEIREIPKDQVLNDIKIRAEGVSYKAKVSIIPIIDSEASLVETMLIFNRISKRIVQD
jgi:signal transduction histidine kinase